MLLRAFRTDDGLGPSFNGDSCASCHQGPVAGGSAPRYRDMFLLRTERQDGALIDAGTNGSSPVRNIYSLDHGHVAEPLGVVVSARRNAPSGFGVGLFEFIPPEEILAREDTDDADGDGISGKANYEQNRVGFLGYKSQASGMESFNRGAFFNQMGVTTNPLFHDFPENEPVASNLMDVIVPSAWAQVSAPGEPTTDDDGVVDPELGDQDQLDLLIFSTYLAAPRPAERTKRTRAAAALFDKVGCTDCHVPTLQSAISPIPAYTDLLVHDMGPENSDGLTVGLADPQEFRTAPLWGVAMHPPYLHDGRVDTLHEAIEAHGGEGEASKDAYLALSVQDQAEVVHFLESLGEWVSDNSFLTSPLHEQAGAGELGGPVEGLSDQQQAAFFRGQKIFDQNTQLDQGLGTFFNADSCRACHQDPVLGGAGGIDTNVVRKGRWDGEQFSAVAGDTLPRMVVPGSDHQRLSDEANVVEFRQPPSALGLGLLDNLPDAVVAANEDPADADNDGISGRARRVGGRVGRFGWKAQIPTLQDFLADAELNEIGRTADPALSTFTGTDDDQWADPELPNDTFEDMLAYLRYLGPPARSNTDDPQVTLGEELFGTTGCADCHLPDLGGVAAYTDLLLHEVASPDAPLVSQEEGVFPSEFRTPPLWGIAGTAPYMHDGLAPDLHSSILAHFGESEASKLAYEALSAQEQAALVAFLRSL